MNTRRAAMSEQPATTSRVKAGFCGSPASPIFPLLAERFDLWLEQERAAARREGQAEAWNKGFEIGYGYCDEALDIEDTVNPYWEGQ